MSEVPSGMKTPVPAVSPVSSEAAVASDTRRLGVLSLGRGRPAAREGQATAGLGDSQARTGWWGMSHPELTDLAVRPSSSGADGSEAATALAAS